MTSIFSPKFSPTFGHASAVSQAVCPRQSVPGRVFGSILVKFGQLYSAQLILTNFDQFDQFCQMLSYSGSPWGASREAKRNPWVVQGGPRETIGAPGGSHGVQLRPKKGPREAIRTTGGGHRVPREARPVAKSCQKRTKTGLRKAKMARRGRPE